MLWAAAYLRGDAGPDDAAELSLGVGHHAVGGEGEDLFDWMTGLRRLPLAQLRLVLPRPGRIAGLVGPPSALPAAVEAEQGVVGRRRRAPRQSRRGGPGGAPPPVSPIPPWCPRSSPWPTVVDAASRSPGAGSTRRWASTWPPQPPAGPARSCCGCCAGRPRAA